MSSRFVSDVTSGLPFDGRNQGVTTFPVASSWTRRASDCRVLIARSLISYTCFSFMSLISVMRLISSSDETSTEVPNSVLI